jgi:hypothetical protein
MSKAALRKLDKLDVCQFPDTEIESVILPICLKEKLKKEKSFGSVASSDIFC